MANYVLLTKLSPEALKGPLTAQELSHAVNEKIKTSCPEAKWIANYALLGPYDYLDIFEAPNDGVATKVAMIVRSFGHATTETWTATPWDQFLELMKQIKA